MTAILAYDDSRPRRESLKALIDLTPGMQWVGGFENCKEVEAQMMNCQPDVVLMDIQMPGTDGIEGLIRIKQHFPTVKVIMQTAFDDDEKVFKALQAGAEGYILKSATAAQIIQGIEDVLKGGAAITPSIALKVMQYFREKPSMEPANDHGLTPKEREVLRLLAEGQSYKMVADQLNNSYFTVNNHVKKIYQKLQVHCLAEAVIAAQKSRLV